jgi:hypothetical protein
VGELIHWCREIEVTTKGHVRLGPLGHGREDLEVLLDLLGHAGPRRTLTTTARPSFVTAP